ITLEERPDVFIDPVLGAAVNPDYKLVLHGSHISNVDTRSVTYLWSVVQGAEYLNLSSNSFPTDDPFLVIPAGSLTELVTYTLRLEVTDDSGVGYNEISFSVHPRPTSGVCSVEPALGIAGLSSFKFTCLNWNDPSSGGVEG